MEVLIRMKTKKKIVFLDGDGTLWYPKSTTNTIKPHWIYADKNPDLLNIGYVDLLTLTPGVVETLTELKRLGIYVIVVSTNPRPIQEATKDIENRIIHFGLTKLIDEFYPAPDEHNGKGRVIQTLLNEKGISKDAALMVGDSYKYDYLPVRAIDVDTLFIKTPYNKGDVEKYGITPTISTIREILNFI